MFNFESSQQTIQLRRAADQGIEELLAAGVLEQHQDPHMLDTAFVIFCSGRSHLTEIRQSLEKEEENTEELDESNMPPNKKVINPSSDSHDSNFAIVNYESSQQTIDEHTEVENNTFSLSRLHWTDSLEIILVGAAALFLFRYVRKFLKKRRQREEAARQAQLVSTLQESIPMSTMTPTAPGVPMLEDKSLQNTRGMRPSSFRLYQP